MFAGNVGFLGTLSTSMISRSFQVTLHAMLSPNDIQPEVLVLSIPAPSNRMTSYHSLNCSHHFTFLVFALTQGKKQAVTLWIDKLAWDGWSGMKCEFGGIWFSSVLTYMFEFGPFCKRHDYMDDFLLVQRKLYLYEGHLVVYTTALFTIYITFNTGTSNILGFSLPVCSKLPDVSMDTQLGTLDIQRCTYHFGWNTITEFHAEFFPLCIPQSTSDSLDVVIHNE